MPTLQAQLQLTGFDVDIWYAILAPKKTPRPTIERLAAALKDILALPETKAAFDAHRMTTAYGSPEQLRALMSKDAARWASLIKAKGIAPE